jgi:hypothetical protein
MHPVVPLLQSLLQAGGSILLLPPEARARTVPISMACSASQLCCALLLLLLQLRHSERQNELSWGLAAFTVESSSDLQAMRTALKDDIDYFESDLVGFTSIRALHDAAGHGHDNEYNIPYRALLDTQVVKNNTPKGNSVQQPKPAPKPKAPLLGSTCMSGGEVDWSCIQAQVSIIADASGRCSGCLRLALSESTEVVAQLMALSSWQLMASSHYELAC